MPVCIFICQSLSERRTVPCPIHSLSYLPYASPYHTLHNAQRTPTLTPQIPKEKNKEKTTGLYDRILLRCFIVKKLISKNRSTQLAKHPSSPLSSFDPLIFPVTHFFQQICVRLCVSTIRKKTKISFILPLVVSPLLFFPTTSCRTSRY